MQAKKPTTAKTPPPANQQWSALADKHHDSDIWQRMFALRVGLCAMVENSQISLDRATRIFERERQQALRQLGRLADQMPMGST